MSAEGILDNPALYSNNTSNIIISDINRFKLQLSMEYLELAQQYPTSMKTIIFHLRRMLKAVLTSYDVLADILSATSILELYTIICQIGIYLNFDEKNNIEIQNNNIAHQLKEFINKYYLKNNISNALIFSDYKNDNNRKMKQKSILEKMKREEGKRKAFEDRMKRKAKRMGFDLNYYLQQGFFILLTRLYKNIPLGCKVPTFNEIDEIKKMDKKEAIKLWKVDIYGILLMKYYNRTMAMHNIVLHFIAMKMVV